MKLLQVICELLVLTLAVLELIFTIQLNATVRVPGNMTLIPVAIIVVIVVLIFFEIAESRHNHQRKKKMEQKYENRIEELKKQQTENTGSDEQK
ncbi:MAG: hypothetical protein IJI05_05295 [Erysipelotrichaceae bacterium]|nr:hypothetical protein [Erysipelotrichaceae bacterium]